MTAGDDGEGFLIGPNHGLGKRRIVQFELNQLKPRLDWGNQQGLRKVDMHAIKGVSLYFYGGQANHLVKVYSMKLKR